MNYNTGEEVWKDVEGYEGLYSVSSLGNVWNVKRSMYMKPKVNKGYLIVGLTKDKKQKWFSVHRLVALAFIENPENKKEVNHLDEDKLNNAAINIEWATSKENANWGTRVDRIFQSAKEKKIAKGSKILQICLQTGKVISEYSFASEASRKTGIPTCSISKCLNGKQESSRGYVWKYKTN